MWRLEHDARSIQRSNKSSRADHVIVLCQLQVVELFPVSFASYTMSSALQRFALEVAECLDWSRSLNADSTVRIGGVL